MLNMLLYLTLCLGLFPTVFLGDIDMDELSGDTDVPAPDTTDELAQDTTDELAEDTADELSEFIEEAEFGREAEKSSKIIRTFPTLPKVYTVEFSLQLNKPINGKWTSVLHFTTYGNIKKFGYRIPAIFFRGRRLHICSSLNRNKNTCVNYHNFPLERLVKIKIVYAGPPSYWYIVYVDGKEIKRIRNKKPQTYNNVLVYGPDKWHLPFNGFFSEFKVTFGETEIERKTLRTFPTLPKVYAVNLTLQLAEIRKEWASVVHFTVGGNDKVFGDRIPAIFFKRRTLAICSSVNRRSNCAKYKNFPLNKLIKVRIEYSGPPSYFYTVSVDGKEIKREKNKNPLTYNNVKVYASDGWYPPFKGTIEELKVQLDDTKDVVGVWDTTYYGKYTYTITKTEVLGDSYSPFKIETSDNQNIFPSKDGWLKAAGGKKGTYFYFRLTQADTLEIRYFGPQYKYSYKGLKNYFGKEGVGKRKGGAADGKQTIDDLLTNPQPSATNKPSLSPTAATSTFRITVTNVVTSKASSTVAPVTVAPVTVAPVTVAPVTVAPITTAKPSAKTPKICTGTPPASKPTTLPKTTVAKQTITVRSTPKISSPRPPATTKAKQTITVGSTPKIISPTPPATTKGPKAKQTITVGSTPKIISPTPPATTKGPKVCTDGPTKGVVDVSKITTAKPSTPKKATLKNPMDSCKLELIGCFKDNKADRAMPDQILNEVDTNSKVYSGISVTWSNYKAYLEEFACRCAKTAFSKGYSVIGLQSYGECWSGPQAHQTYNKHGESKDCVDGNKKKMIEGSDCKRYVGKEDSNFVYRIAVSGCTNLQIEPVGCFHDNMVKPRPIPNYIMNERDKTNKGWNGHLIDWKGWLNYSPKMICRCAEAAKKRGATYFSIQYFAECWSGTAGDVDYDRNGPSKKCVNEYFKECKCNSYNCVGVGKTNYVYKILS